MVPAQIDDGLEGDKFTTFWTFDFDYEEDYDVLNEDWVNWGVVDPYFNSQSNDGRVPVANSEG